jgi:Superinfection immunity protein
MKMILATVAALMTTTPAFAGDGNAASGFVILAFLIGSYFFPAIIAGARGHHNTLAIFILNLFLGWTGLGWIGALVWAATAVQQR